jgi:NlpC/P60 family
MPRVRKYESSVAASYFVQVGCWAFALCAGAVTASAQKAPAPQPAAPAVRLVNAEEGREIAAAALEQDGPISGRQDCSHLVHQVYSDAGYDYPYASSFDLYAGNGKFRRIRHPQAGDLVAWPGHVGIVLDPREHTFYSLVRSGLQAEDYLGPYWRSRGRARFYRYLVDTRASRALVQTAEAAPTARPRPKKPAPVSAVAAGEEVAEAERPARPSVAIEASERTPVMSARPEPLSKDTADSIPSSVAISTRGRPSADEVADGISELSNAAASVLRTNEPLKAATPVVIFDELKVERVEIKGDKGWAHLQINSRVRISGEGADFKARREKVRWELRRQESGWVALAPTERVFVPRDGAVRVLAAQLAEMSQSEAAARHDETVIGQEARIANLLSSLLEK